MVVRWVSAANRQKPKRSSVASRGGVTSRSLSRALDALKTHEAGGRRKARRLRSIGPSRRSEKINSWRDNPRLILVVTVSTWEISLASVEMVAGAGDASLLFTS